MRRHTVRFLASVLIWIGGVELFASFVAKMVLDVKLPHQEVFIAVLMVGFVSWIVSTLFYWK
ncbi:MAG TPA: hypothetical protein VFV52_07735 [Bacilli bacterium]|nr:hypothetical protein [Bacilli bacterium]